MSIEILFKDRNVQFPYRYIAENNPDGTITLYPSPGEVYEQGTPINATNLNKIVNEHNALEEFAKRQKRIWCWDSAGSYTWVTPKSAYYKISVWGGGGYATDRSSKGSGGGLSIKIIYLLENTSHTLVVGSGGISTSITGGRSSFDVNLYATGGGSSPGLGSGGDINLEGFYGTTEYSVGNFDSGSCGMGAAGYSFGRAGFYKLPAKDGAIVIEML